MKHDIVIIGGGPAGLAAAAAAREAGARDILILEREKELGGILNQCIHNGFGLHTFHEELTGPEYAARFIAQIQELQIPYLLSTTVIDLSSPRLQVFPVTFSTLPELSVSTFSGQPRGQLIQVNSTTGI